MQVRTKTGRLGIGILISVPEWSDMSSHLQNNNIIPPQQNLCGRIKITLKKEQSFKIFIKQGTSAQVA
jgi:hypothetical protein